MSLTPPEDEDISRLAKQCLIAEGLVHDLLGETLDQTPRDLRRIQDVLNTGRCTDTFELQCLGIAFGRVLAKNVSGLDWAIADDEYGHDPTIRFAQTTLQFNVLTMISKRVERGESVNVQDLYDSMLLKLSELKKEVD
jgi:hypothetical protein